MKQVVVCVLATCLPLAGADVKLVADGFQFPEGPSVDAQGNVYLADLGNGIIPKIAPDGSKSTFADTGGTNQSTLFDESGNLYVCHNEPGRTGILKISRAGQVSEVALTSDGNPIRRTNDMAWGPGGRLYFTGPSTNMIHPEGEIHFIDTDGKARRFASGFAFVNGITFSPDKTYLYAGEERAGRNAGWLWRFRIRADGMAEERGKELFYAFSGRQYGFDGMKFDEKGNLWVAMYSEAALWCISPEGKHIDTIPVPGKNPTNLIFAGADRRTAYVTVKDDKNGKLIQVRMPVPGAP
jgi:gluconolactonase